jgi:23S rRNA pseudouridine955/2504/2580 synthase
VDSKSSKLPQHISSSVQYLTIDEDHDGQRLDNFLFSQFKQIPKSRIYRAIRNGEVRVNSQRADASQKLQAEDRIRIPPFKIAETVKKVFTAPDKVLQELNSRILFENNALLIINKPAGIPVHGGSDQQWGVIEALRTLKPEVKFLELVHRIDKETSGCLLIAKKRTMLTYLHELFRERVNVKKTYWALVAGHWPKSIHYIDVSLQKNTLASGGRVVRVNEATGKTAKTLFKPLKYFKDATLIEARPLTGRTHQIRVHAKAAGHPLIGDDKYGEKVFNKTWRKRGLHRMFLHAYALEFLLDDEKFSICAELDMDMQAILETIA